MTANELHAYRLNRNITQIDLAKILGLNVRTISRYETGKSKIPKSISSLLKFMT